MVARRLDRPKPAEIFTTAMYLLDTFSDQVTVEAEMSKEAVFTAKLEPALCDAFLAAGADESRPASQIVLQLARAYIERRERPSPYDVYLAHKIEAARTSMQAGRGRLNDKVEAKFAARCAGVTTKA